MTATRIVTFTIVIDGQEILVCYQPDWACYPDLCLRNGLFEFRSPHLPRRRIPVSETGYRCHYAPMDDVEACASAEDYARELAVWLVHHKDPSEDAEDEQLSLF
jgi:hypothetical protein